MGGVVSVTSSATLTTLGSDSAGIFAQSVGGGGGNGGTSYGLFSAGGSGGSGANGEGVTVINSGLIQTGTIGAINSPGILAQSVGGGGGNGGGAISGGPGFSAAFGGTGGSGGAGGTVTVGLDNVNFNLADSYEISTQGNQSAGIFAQSVGGGGGNGGFAVSGAVGPIAITLGVGGSGGPGGGADTVGVTAKGIIYTDGLNSAGIFAQSVGGGGGNGGATIAVAGGAFSAPIALGGSGGQAGNAGAVTIFAQDFIATQQANSPGVFAQSIGGGGGNGGFAVSGSVSGVAGISVGIGGNGGAGGTAQAVNVTNAGAVLTQGDNSDGVAAQSIGGGGGNGGFSVSAAIAGGASAAIGVGGKGGAGQDAGAVNVTVNSGGQTTFPVSTPGTWNLVTEGLNSIGVFAESVGGGGGAGGFAGSLALGGAAGVGVSIGGSGSGGGSGMAVHVISGDATYSENILTEKSGATGILAQSVGGGGGDGGFAVSFSGSGSIEGVGGAAAVSLGGSGGVGGAGSTAEVDSIGHIYTEGALADGIITQSIGGGGGNGGFSLAGTVTGGLLGAAVAVGGSGGSGVSANTATLNSQGDITTLGAQSVGLFAQSVGGGGGNGGFAGAGSLTLDGVSAAVGVGGGSGSGGGGGLVNLTSVGSISTAGDSAAGIIAQSVGGGGGDGGSTIGLSVGAVGGATVTVGRSGGSGGDAMGVTVSSTGAITTGAGYVSGPIGANAPGILAQSVGGGGGAGGFSGALSVGGVASVGVGLGGAGGGGGDASTVMVTGVGDISTAYNLSPGIIAQSVGGGGGAGGFSVVIAASGAIEEAGGAAAVAIGGSGGGGAGNMVTVSNTGTILTTGALSDGVLAQSVGGGGGDGGFAVSGAFTIGAAGIGVAVGGSGSAGGAAGNVTLDSYSVASGGAPVAVAPAVGVTTIETTGAGSSGLFAQSVGGGGGAGGFAASAGAALQGAGVGVSVGGSGGAGADAGSQVTVLSYNNIITSGAGAFGIFAQSVGGGGGDGGFTLSISGGNEFAGSVSVGGSGNSAGAGKAVTVTSYGNIGTSGAGAIGLVAQSIGGGGGNGGFALSGSLAAGQAGLAVSVGGQGASGGAAGAVIADSTGDISTTHSSADGILAQSIGGGGGNGGFSGSLAIGLDGGALGVTVGGFGSGGGGAGTVNVTSIGDITTQGASSNGIFAQSVGGGGGNGGGAISLSGANEISASVAVGGFGGGGQKANTVEVDSTGAISTQGADSNGIWAQSIGGGGGAGGFALTGSLAVDGPAGVSIAVGGFGGGAAQGEMVTVNSNVGTTLSGNPATISTNGADSNGIFAQSVGGGGGAGGFSGAVSLSLGSSTSAAVSLSLGGFGGSGGDAGEVFVTSVDNILTTQQGSNGILAQSLGGGGGAGGFSFAGSLTATGTNTASVSASVGGFGGSAGVGEMVTVMSTGGIQTGGDNADGVLAQSIGGGGGAGGLSVAAAIGTGATASGPINVSASVGGFGGAAGNGGVVMVTRDGSILTTGDQSIGIFAQSVGGGGGDGGMSLTGSFGGSNAKNISATVGGFGGAAGNGETVTVMSTGAITTLGTSSQGIFAQSVGGGGGDGGFAASAIIGVAAEKTNFNLGVTVGGFGGAGGIGGAVNVTNDGEVSTTGADSQGIVAQSIGGGGGNGGGAFSGDVGLIGGTEGKSINATITVGGFGGSGNISGAVMVDQTGGITTGAGAAGIEAQSIGGGGGNGGAANSLVLVIGKACTLPLVCTAPMQINSNISVQLNLGGFGGAGNDGNTVTVANHSFIETSGVVADGIFAESVGGGGGNGGNAVVGLSGLVPPAAAYGPLLFTPITALGFLKNISIAVGGWGGSSGNGEMVTVTNSGELFISGAFSDGIDAQSIGGGGGDGGKAIVGLTGTIGIGGGAFDHSNAGGTGGTVMVTNNAGADIYNSGAVFSDGIFAQSIGGGGGSSGAGSGIIDIGGWGGTGSNGGTVTVSNAATVETAGLFSDAIAAQSVGGGGGDGGGGGLSVVALGGFAGAAGDGGPVTVTNSGFVLTIGAESDGVFAESVGGGGGHGGGSYNTSSITGVVTDFNLVTIGGEGGAAGDGGLVKVINSGVIETTNLFSNGIFAQSVGGGGGAAGGGEGLVQIGLSTGASGDGGGVTILNNAGGSIYTYGDLSAGIFAQSVGGGGGSTGKALGGVTWNQSGHGGGAGGTVMVTNSAAIATVGINADGIFAQSVGGGGGSVASANGAITIGGSGGTGGAGGAVTVLNNAAISTIGAGANGVFAQSIGGGGGVVNAASGGLAFAGTTGGLGAGGAVTITDAANVTATGANAFAILGQSAGSTNGVIAITVNSGVVEGGTGSGAGVGFLNGLNNTLVNYGEVMAVNGLAGFAVTGGSANEAIDNYANAIGSVDMGGGINTFHNHTAGFFEAGPEIYLGVGTGLLTNDGVLQIGKSAPLLSQDLTAAQTTAMTGDFVQTASGHMVIDLSYGPFPSDLLNISGTANVAGEFDITLLKLENDQPITVITTTGGAALSGATAPGTIALTFTPQVVGDNIQIDLTPHFQSDLPRPNERAMGYYFNHVLDVGGATGLNDLLLFLGEEQDPVVYRRAFDLLSPEPYLSAYQSALFAGEDAAGNVMSCKTADTTFSAITETGCGWVKVASKTLQRANTDIDFGYTDTSQQLSTGVQRKIAPNLFLGASLGWDTHSTVETDVPASITGNFLYGAAVLKWQEGPSLLALAVSGGSGQFSSTRQINVLGSYTAEANFNVSFITVDARAAYLFERDVAYAKPTLDLIATNAKMGAFAEVGAGNIGSTSPGAEHTSFAIKPAIELGLNIADLQDLVIRPWFSGGAAFRPDATFALPAAFVGSQAGAGDYTITTRVDRIAATLDSGLEFIKPKAYTISLGYSGEYSRSYKREGGRLKISIPF